MAIGFDPNLLLGFYAARSSTSLANSASNVRTPTATQSSLASLSQTPWSALPLPQAKQDNQVLNAKNFIDLSKVPVSANNEQAKLEQDNQKLFALYNAANSVAYLAGMGRRDGMSDGQLAGFNTRFQAGIAEIERFIDTAKFNNLTLQAAKPASSLTSTISLPGASFNYKGSTIVTQSKLSDPLAGVSASDSFTIAVKKGATTTNVDVDMSGISGALTLDKILAHANQQLSNAGFTTRLTKTVTKGVAGDTKNPASYAVQLTPGVNENVSLSSASTKPALYLAGAQGLATASSTTAANQTGRVVKLTDIDGASPQSLFSTTIKSDSGITDALATQVDANGDVYVVGNTAGSFGNQLNQATQDVYLSKYDSAGNLEWRQLLGAGDSASGYSLALNPAGGVVVAGSTTGALTSDAVSNGNNGSFVSKFDGSGNQVWTRQVKTLAENQGLSVSVDAGGNVLLAGQVKGFIAAGQTNAGGEDAYAVKLSSLGTTLWSHQYGTAANEKVAATSFDENGDLIVASVENGRAILSKYTGGDMRTAAVWQMDVGDLQGGAITGLAVRDGKVAVSGTTMSSSLNAGGAASTAIASSGGQDAFVFTASDNGASVSANEVSYLGTDLAEKGGNVVIDSAGKVYLTGTTLGTFAGQTRNDAKAENMFVTALNSDGTLDWTKQYGGAEGRSTGAGIALDESGASVLDALGLPKGSIDLSQSVDLAQSTNLRPGDSFQIKLEGSASRTAKVTIEKDETMSTLARKISTAMVFAGKAEVVYSGGGKSLKISLKPGVTMSLIEGPKDSDALGRLGISPGTLANVDEKKADPNAKKVFGLGLPDNLDISTKIGAGGARAQLLNVLSSIRDVYHKLNTPAAQEAAQAGKTGGTVSPYLQNQISGYNLALAAMGGSSGSFGTF